MTEKTLRSKTMGMIKFKDALSYAFPEIINAFYWIDKETSEEWVCVTWQDSDKKPQGFQVCVTADSVVAMYDDVWKECKRRFA